MYSTTDLIGMLVGTLIGTVIFVPLCIMAFLIVYQFVQQWLDIFQIMWHNFCEMLPKRECKVALRHLSLKEQGKLCDLFIKDGSIDYLDPFSDEWKTTERPKWCKNTIYRRSSR